MIREHYPRAWQHLQDAQQAKAAMAVLWGRVLENGLVEEGLVTDADGSGVIGAWVVWPPGAWAELTRLLHRCVVELWACLDALVEESPSRDRGRGATAAGHTSGSRPEQMRKRLRHLNKEGLVDRVVLPQAGKLLAWYLTGRDARIAARFPELEGVASPPLPERHRRPRADRQRPGPTRSPGLNRSRCWTGRRKMTPGRK
ncbi:hypothetical protein AB0I39_27950 [Kitasatospora purpeofusca]|uniref:hypothetical protein n=1 Tax=Kitasatospora purpeofusca TaxID=67352 RepID=UPI0033C88ED8